MVYLALFIACFSLYKVYKLSRMVDDLEAELAANNRKADYNRKKLRTILASIVDGL